MSLYVLYNEAEKRKYVLQYKIEPRSIFNIRRK